MSVMKTENTLIAALLQFVRDNPGVTGTDLQKNFRSLNTASAISATLGRLQRAKLIENRGNSGRYSKWFPVGADSIDPELVQMASWMIQEMKVLPPGERARYLALRLRDLL